MSRPKILLTNDDGINSGGLWATYDALSLFADVTVVAPATQQSAVGRSISIFEPIRMNEVTMHETQTYSVEGRPTDALLLGLYGLGLKPNLVVSGINLGENISFESITTSGTVGAAMEAVNQGIPALAYSLQMNDQGNKFADPRTHTTDFTQTMKDLGPIGEAEGLSKEEVKERIQKALDVVSSQKVRIGFGNASKAVRKDGIWTNEHISGIINKKMEKSLASLSK